MGITRVEKKDEHTKAKELAKKHADWEKGKKLVRLPHPSEIRNTWILKAI